jgi:hypothetical protein
MERGINGSRGRCSNEVVVLKSKCVFNVDGHCIVGLKCSYLDLNGNVCVCRYHPNKRGRFTFRRQKC